MSSDRKHHIFIILIYVFNNIPLKNKLLIYYSLLIFFSIVFIRTFSYYNMEKYILEQTGNSLGQTLTQQKINIEERLNTYDAMVKHVVTDKSLIFALLNQ